MIPKITWFQKSHDSKNHVILKIKWFQKSHDSKNHMIPKIMIPRNSVHIIKTIIGQNSCLFPVQNAYDHFKVIIRQICFPFLAITFLLRMMFITLTMYYIRSMGCAHILLAHLALIVFPCIWIGSYNKYVFSELHRRLQDWVM